MRDLTRTAFLTTLALLCVPALADSPDDTFLPPAPTPVAPPEQPPPPPTPTPAAPAPKPAGPPAPNPVDAILELQSAYRNSSSCERVQFEVHYPAPAPATGTRIARSTISIQLSGPPAGSNPDTPEADPAIALELGVLRIFASGGQLTAIHSRDPSTYFQAPIATNPTSKDLGDVLPPVLVPELDLKTAAAASPVNAFWPYATDITWQSVEVDPKHPAKRTIRGQCAGGTVVLVAQNNRLRSLSIDLPAKKTSLALAFSPFGPCEPAKSAIDISRRQRVDAMDELRPRSGTLRVGIRVPHMPITQGLAGQPGGGWDMGSFLQPPTQAEVAGVKPAEHVVLVFLRQTPLAAPPDASKEQRFNPDALAKILRTMREEAFKARMPATPSLDNPPTSPAPLDKDPAIGIAKFGYAPVLVMGSPNPDDLLKKIREANGTWPEVLWTTEAKSTIDLFAPTADAAAIILDSEFVLRAVIPIEPSQTAEQVGDQLAAALFELGAGDK
jgi:hypothetical protein